MARAFSLYQAIADFFQGCAYPDSIAAIFE